MKIDYYKVLGVARDASATEIKQAFRRLALEFHPDRHVQSSIASQDAAGHRFKQVSEAYEVLGDNLKRVAYNNGTHYAGTQGAGPSRRYEGPPRRRYYRRTKEGYTTYGSAQARAAYDRGTGVRWRPETESSSAERKERIINTIFFGFALPIFLFADYIETAFRPKRTPYPAMNCDPRSHPEKPKAAECTRKGAMKTSLPEKRPVSQLIKCSDDQGCKSLLGNRRVGYTYMVSPGLRKLESSTDLAQKLPESGLFSSGPQQLRSLLMMEYRLSDLRLGEINTWLRKTTQIPIDRDGS